ncbi:MAG: TIM barrel protein [Alphaproteobacteria bacterium]
MQQVFFPFGTIKVATHAADDTFPAEHAPKMEQSLDDIWAAGFQGCSLGQFMPKNPQNIKSALSSRRLKLCGASFRSYFTEEGKVQDTTQRFIHYRNLLHEFGFQHIVVVECGHNTFLTDKPVFEQQPAYNESQWEALSHGLDNLGDLAREKGMQLVFQNHIGTGVNNLMNIFRLLMMTDPKSVNFALDTGQLYLSGISIPMIVRDFKERIKYVRVRDVRPKIVEKAKAGKMSYRAARNAGIYTFPGNGAIDFGALFVNLKSANYEGWIVIENDDQSTDSKGRLSGVRRGRQHVREITGV